MAKWRDVKDAINCHGLVDLRQSKSFEARELIWMNVADELKRIEACIGIIHARWRNVR